MTLSTTLSTAASVPDLLRLLAVPVFAWVAIRDIKTRRVSSRIWIPLSGLGAVLLLWDGWVAREAGGAVWTHDFLVPAAISLGFVVPIAYLFWWVGGFGGADAKALMVLALLFPVFPAYTLGSWTLPLEQTGVGAFSFTILTNAVLVGVLIPVVLAVRNGLAGRIAPVMLVGWPVTWQRTEETHGRLLQRPDGLTLTGGGLDLDALRMYLRWRGLTLADIRAEPDRYRDPATLPADPNPPTDGAVATEGILPDGGSDDGDGLQSGASSGGDLESDTDSNSEAEPGPKSESGPESERHPDPESVATHDDPWGAHAFLTAIDGSAYGTSPDQLREGLEVLCDEETVWVSPGTPFLVPVFVGLVIALVYGDLLVSLLL